MRRSIAAVALIRREEAGRTYWLAQWNRNWHAFSFIGGHKQPEESFRECLVREIGEELGLTEGADFVLARTSAAQLQYNAWSQAAHEETAYTIELFAVRLRPSAYAIVDGNPANRWLLESDIRTGHCADGLPISNTVNLILRQGQGIPE